MELDRYTNSQLPSSKFPEMRGSLAFTCVARAQCTTTPQLMHHRIALVERYPFAKYRVASSKFPENESALACARA